MSDLTARSRIEAWKKQTQGVGNLGYERNSDTGAGAVWTVRIDFSPDGVVDRVAVHASATELEQACEAAIAGLVEYGIDVRRGTTGAEPGGQRGRRT